MSFELTREQRDLQERSRQAIVDVVAPVAAQVAPGAKLDSTQMKTIYKGLAPLGLLGSTISKDLGGAGMSYVDYGLMLKELAKGPVIMTEVVAPRAIAHLGTPDQKRRWLPKLLSGDLICCGAVTEPQAGSDLRNLQMTALPQGEHLIVNGRKRWIHLAANGDLVNVVAVTDPSKGGHGGTGRLIIERDQSPWTTVEIDCVGMTNLSLGELRFDDVRVPKENLLNPGADGTKAFKGAIESSRAWIGLVATGIAEAAIDKARLYCQERHAFGRPLARFQAVQLALADAAAKIEAASLLALRALWEIDQGGGSSRSMSMAKFVATEAAVSACSAAMSCMGAYGLSVEAGVERHWRDAKMLTVMDGASDIQRLIVGRELLGTQAFV